MLYTQLKNAVDTIKVKKPLVLNLTNIVTMDMIANCLLAIGAAPIMSNDKNELEELIQLANAVVINIGTLNSEFIDLINAATKLTMQYNKQLIVDPVGAGASLIRTKRAYQLLSHATIVRGNASEILALSGILNRTLGVESVHSTAQAEPAARILSQQFNLVTIVSGEHDLICSQKNARYLHYGSTLMPSVTGMGCALTAVIAAFNSACADPFTAALLGTCYYTLCAEQAESIAQGPASFRSAFIDALYKPKLSHIKNRMENLYDTHSIIDCRL